jgi:hypothetical protein
MARHKTLVDHNVATNEAAERVVSCLHPVDLPGSRQRWDAPAAVEEHRLTRVHSTAPVPRVADRQRRSVGPLREIRRARDAALHAHAIVSAGDVPGPVVEDEDGGEARRRPADRPRQAGPTAGPRSPPPQQVLALPVDARGRAVDARAGAVRKHVPRVVAMTLIGPEGSYTLPFGPAFTRW